MTIRLVSVLLISSVFGSALSACGGGGGSGGNSDSGSGTAGSAAATSAPAAASSAASSPAAVNPASGGTGNPPAIPQSSIPNVQPIAVSAAPGLTRNMLTTSVTVCAPGTGNCATIDNIQVDTGSQGLRILASALPATLQLPTLPSGSGTAGECAVFGGGYTWGAVRSADVQMAGQLAASLPVQLIGDSILPTVPSDCASSGLAMQTVATLRSNGILGVGQFAADCGGGCVNSALPRWYYSCTGVTCQASAQPLDQQVTNPVSAFALDNNGVVIDLPAVADAGAPTVSGSLIFGIGTQANNVLGSATVLRTNAQSGFVTTISGGQTYSLSYLDSGSNALFLSNGSMPQCGLWYCPATPQALSAEITGTDGTTSTVAFSVANSQTLFNSSNNAFDNLAGIASNSFGWGLPFFYGRRVFTAIESRLTSAGAGPYYAF